MNTQGAAAGPAHAGAVETLESRITRTPGVCGGDACIRGTRIPVWLLVEQRRLGESDDGILESHPTLSSADLEAAWDYYTSHRAEIEESIRQNNEA